MHLDPRRGTQKRLGLGSRGAWPGRPQVPAPGSGWRNQEQTVRLLMSGRRSRKKPMYGEMKCDMPGMKPDPSLGDQPRDRAHTTRLLGAPRPAEPAVLEPDRLASLETEASNPDAKDQRSRGDCDIPETRPPRTSCSGCTGFRGDRVHRGEPLLLGVDKEYQISYRLFARGTMRIPRASPQRSVPVPLRGLRISL